MRKAEVKLGEALPEERARRQEATRGSVPVTGAESADSDVPPASGNLDR